MISQIRAELLKLRSTRTTLGLLLGMLALVILFSLLTGLLSHAATLTGADNQRNLLSLGSTAGVFSALAGVLLITSEYRYGTVRPTYLFTPSRTEILSAKVVAGAIAGLIFGIIGEGVGFAIGEVILSARSIPSGLGGGSLAQLLIATVVSTGLFGVFGVGLGAIIRNQVGGIITLLAWGFVVDNLLFGLLPVVGRYTPTYASNGFLGLRADHLLGAAAGGLVLTAWALGLVVVGLALFSRRDIT